MMGLFPSISFIFYNMIDETKTFLQFDYVSSELSYGSGREIITICNNCGKIRILKFFQYRDLCKRCGAREDERNEKLRIAQTGKLASEETKRKMSISHSGENHYLYGKHLPPETCKKISIGMSGENNPNYGKHLSFETCKKISIANSGENHYLYGRCPSEETCKKLSNNIRKAYQNKRWNSQVDNFINGDNITDWIKPATNNYDINYEEYDIWRHKVYIRDNYTCQICGDKNCMIHAHHIIPQRENQDLILDINNGITLCPRCHRLTFNKEILFAEELQMIINGNI